MVQKSSFGLENVKESLICNYLKSTFKYQFLTFDFQSSVKHPGRRQHLLDHGLGREHRPSHGHARDLHQGTVQRSGRIKSRSRCSIAMFL